MSEHSHGASGAHEHDFDAANPLAEQRTRWVVMLTAVTMVVELLAGWWYGSMALLADGWHMSSHVIALGLSVAAYALARRLRRDARFAFGTWKIEVLGGYTSALLLAGVVLLMAYECVTRLVRPEPVAYDQALLVAVLGLGVNLASAWILAGAARGEGHEHGYERRHADLNLRSAHIHVAADAATSLLAIGALAGGKYLQLGWLDAGVGLFGSAVVAAWAWSLLRSTGRLLLDADMDAPIVSAIRLVMRDSPLPARLDDLHVWRVGKGRYACIVSVTAAAPATPDYFRSLLRVHGELVHVTVEVNPPAFA
ncbi:MAG: CDF family Co(II)/Ni(II) efflux transporter DmeF [Gammaproteobacteria bacterium]|nr:CDF family Co(II)/Ni(II) efflux transporter DmeF [Gammaproteobacteria bacterium]MDE2249897.1 CDF family Co(II)/Ni(II) efflux transporter DmeF [Gammaproteobacteria bacterium]